LSFFNVSARHIATPNLILGMALGYGGLVQLIAGVEEWACGNTFGATLYIPQFGVIGMSFRH